MTKNRRVRASFSAAEIHFLKRVSFFEMNWDIVKRCSGDIRKYPKIRDGEYLLY